MEYLQNVKKYFTDLNNTKLQWINANCTIIYNFKSPHKILSYIHFIQMINIFATFYRTIFLHLHTCIFKAASSGTLSAKFVHRTSFRKFPTNKYGWIYRFSMYTLRIRSCRDFFFLFRKQKFSSISAGKVEVWTAFLKKFHSTRILT